MSGWIKLHRSFLNHPIFRRDDQQWRAWVTILLTADHRTGRVNLTMASKFMPTMTKRAWRAFIAKLERHEMLENVEVEGLGRARVMTAGVRNWGRFQSEKVGAKWAQTKAQSWAQKEAVQHDETQEDGRNLGHPHGSNVGAHYKKKEITFSSVSTELPSNRSTHARGNPEIRERLEAITGHNPSLIEARLDLIYDLIAKRGERHILAALRLTVERQNTLTSPWSYFQALARADHLPDASSGLPPANPELEAAFARVYARIDKAIGRTPLDAN